ncbi:WG repeat-containing protein [Pontimicrobium sp. IMCC45349]|uniref:WG repeat-containing protein n=1 Tax=Pontimicrobium sp. IMCC45349 TaxID=3391574 RepID=UPI0039A0680B
MNKITLTSLVAVIFFNILNAQSKPNHEVLKNHIETNHLFGDSLKIPAYSNDDFGFIDKGIYFIKKGEKWGLVNTKSNNQLIPFKIDSVLSINNMQNKSYLIKRDGKWSCIAFNKQFKALKSDPQYAISHSSLKDFGYKIDKREWKRFQVIFNGKRGIMNKAFETIVPIKYDFIRDKYFDYKEDNQSKYFYITFNNDKVGVITHKVTIEPTLDDVGVYYPDYIGDFDNLKPSYKKKDLKALSMFFDFDYKYFGTLVDGKRGIMSYEGKILMPNLYDEMYCGESHLREYGRLFIVKKNGLFGIVNFKNEVVIPIEYDKVEYFDTSKYGTSYIYIVEKNGKFGLINSLNKTVREINYTRKELEN